MIRRVIFWLHLAIGILVGLFIALMSLTGVLLTYEAQMEAWAKNAAIEVPGGAEPLGTDALLAAAISLGGQAGQSLVLPRDPGEAVSLVAGRGRETVINPYTGEAVPDAGAAMSETMFKVMALHRWLSLSGRTELGGEIVKISNLLFFGLLLSGAYLWLPRIWRWSQLKIRLWFRAGLPTVQARDNNWHHVLAFWSVIPLFLIILSGVVISYPWASGMIYSLTGEEAPKGRPAPMRIELPQGLAEAQLAPGASELGPLLAEAGQELAPNWRRVTLILPQAEAAAVMVTFDSGNGQQTGRQLPVVVDRNSGAVMALERPEASPASEWRRYFRFVHTGQVYGIWGQTIAGLASLISLVLVYTGISAGLRRLWGMMRKGRLARI
ncbi:MAG: PepSY-associated TM helix domain-containing protein [Mangrovicoccus sp.]